MTSKLDVCTGNRVNETIDGLDSERFGGFKRKQLLKKNIFYFFFKSPDLKWMAIEVFGG